MAYKFQLGKAKLSGSIETAQGITSQGGLLVNGDVDLDAGVINTAELADLSVTVGKLAADAVETAKIKDLAVTNDKLAGSIASTKIAELNAFDTADLAEGANLYYTDARARAAVSVTDVSGDGSLSYNSSTGVITYTGPSASEVRAHFTGGAGVDIVDGEITVDMTEIAAGLSGSVEAIVGAFVEGSDFVTFDDSTGTIGVSGAAFTGSARSVVSVTDAGGDGSLSYNASTGVITYTGPSAAEARAHFSAVDAGGDGSFSYADGVFTYTGPSASEARAHFSVVDTNSIDMGYDSSTGAFSGSLRLSGSGLEITADGLRIASAAADQGLGWTDGKLVAKVTGSMQIASDKISINNSIAGNGLGHVSDADGAVSSLSVNVDGSTLEINADALRVKDLGITNAKLANSTVAVVAGSALTGGGTVALGSSITLDVAVNGDALEIVGDQVALKSTIAGARTFSGNVTINNLNVTGTMTTINTTNLEVEDARILVASGSTVFASDVGFDFGSHAGHGTLLTAEVDIDGVGGADQVLSSSLPLVAPSMKASTFYGSFVGASILGIVTEGGASATISANVTRANAASQVLTLPSAPSVGQEHRIKCVVADASNPVITIQPASGGKLEGVVDAQITLESFGAAVSLVYGGSSEGWMVF